MAREVVLVFAVVLATAGSLRGLGVHLSWVALAHGRPPLTENQLLEQAAEEARTLRTMRLNREAMQRSIDSLSPTSRYEPNAEERAALRAQFDAEIAALRSPSR